MKAVESEGKTVEEAVSRALLLLGLGASEVEVEVVSEGETEAGAGGMARVRVVPKGGSAPTEGPQAGAVESAQSGEGAPSVSRETTIAAELPAGESSAPSGRFDVAPALEMLRSLLTHMRVDCTAQPGRRPTDDGNPVLDVSGPDCAIVIGRQGQTLDAIEFLVNRMVLNARPDLGRVSVDAEGYRGRRAEKLVRVALEEATRVARGRRAIALEPMSPRDRRTIHLALQDHPQVQTTSEGDGAERHVVIEPARR